jgi:4-amino-4-deoxy-L-arabinose transferase-like glycosyltransferase
LLLATAPRFVFFSRRIAIDIYITLFLTLTLACFVMAERYPQHRRRYLLLMYAAIGLGVLTKGPIALAIPVLVGIAWLVSEKRIGDLSKLMLPSGALIVLAIVLPWYAALYAQHGWEPIRFFFFDENLGRYASAFTTSRSPFFFLFVLFGDILLPWAPLIAIPMLTGWRKTASADPEAAIRRLLWWWVVVTVVIFSLSASKEDLYILPAIPAAAALVADLLVRSSLGAGHRGVRGVLAGIAVLAVAMGILVAVFFSAGHYALAGAWVITVVLTLAGVAAGVLVWRGRYGAAFTTLVAGFIAFNYVFVLRLLPDVERLKPVPTLARTLTTRASPAAVVGSFNMDLPSLVFYTGRRVTRLTDIEHAVRFFGDHPEAWVVLGPGEWQELHARVPSTCIAERAPLFLAKGSDILRRLPPPDVLLVTKCAK